MLQKSFSTTLVVALGILTLSSLLKTSEAMGKSQYETPTVFQASEILPAHLLVGEDYQIRNSVYNDGIHNRYDIKGSGVFLWGVFGEE